MDRVHGKTASRVAMLYTRYPVVTETFLQREALALRATGLEFDIQSLWPAPGPVDCEVQADAVFHPLTLLFLVFWIPYWLARNPRGMVSIARALVESRHPNPVNFWESMLGMGYGILRAKDFSKRYDHLHAVWSSAPGTAAWAIYTLAGIPYSLAGHAYDLFEDGGDGLLPVKIPQARFFRTSTEAGRLRWIELGAPADSVHVIRRGLTTLPEFAPTRILETPVELLAVGRLVEKMGFDSFLEILGELKQMGLPFHATLIGGGPLMSRLIRLANDLGVDGQLTFTGVIPYPEVEPYFRRADLLLFTGKVAHSGDRAGFPNVIGEAMAWGVPVCATSVGAVAEGIQDGVTGLLIQSPGEAALKIQALIADTERYGAIRRAARQWIEREFDANRNMCAFRKQLDAVR